MRFHRSTAGPEMTAYRAMMMGSIVATSERWQRGLEEDEKAFQRSIVGARLERQLL